MKKPKVVFNFVEAGMGHIVPATGVSDAFIKKYGDVCEVVRSYFFSEDKNQILKSVEDSVISDTKKQASSKLHALFMEYGPKIIGERLSKKTTDFVFRKSLPACLEKIKDFDADIIFNTFCFTGHYAVLAKKKYNLDTIVATYIPDPIVHEGWDRNGDLLFTCNDAAFEIANKRRHKDKVFQVPFVLRKEACEISETKEEMRKKLGLPANNFTILLCDGAYGQKNLKLFTEELIKLNEKITVISVCGKNEELFKHFETLKSSANENVTFIPLGFTKNMLELNRASDLFVGKGGANALVEAFYYGNPAIVSSFANNLEKKIANYYITRKGYGEIIFDKKVFIEKILEFIHNPNSMQKYHEKLKEMHDNSGAEKIADILFEKLKEKYPNLEI